MVLITQVNEHGWAGNPLLRIGQGEGERAGVDYRLKDGSMVYVPEGKIGCVDVAQRVVGARSAALCEQLSFLRSQPCGGGKRETEQERGWNQCPPDGRK